jgi:hypothetical protein
MAAMTSVAWWSVSLGSTPKLFEHLLKDMPGDFRDYVLAAVRNDRPEEQRLTLMLDVEDLEAFCIKGYSKAIWAIAVKCSLAKRHHILGMPHESQA